MSVVHADFTIERRYGCTPAQTFSAFADPELQAPVVRQPRRLARRRVGARLPRRRRRGTTAGGAPGRHATTRSAAGSTTSSTDERIVFAYDLLHDHRLISVSLTTIEFLRRRPRHAARCSPSRARSSTSPTAPPSREHGTGKLLDRLGALPRRRAGPMTLTLHEHPFAAYCWKALIALYERDVAVRARTSSATPQDRARLARAVADGEHPRARRRATGSRCRSPRRSSSTSTASATRRRWCPPTRRAALQARLWDRVIDGHVMTPMQKIVGDAPAAGGPPTIPQGVAEARAHARPRLRAARRASSPTGGWLAGPAFTLADCAAAPALLLRARRPPLGRGRPAATSPRYFARAHGAAVGRPRRSTRRARTATSSRSHGRRTRTRSRSASPSVVASGCRPR